VKLVSLNDGWVLKIIPYGETSPMSEHLGGNEVAADNEAKEFFAWECWIVTAGLRSIQTACNEYIQHLKV